MFGSRVWDEIHPIGHVKNKRINLKLTAKTPENGWLEDDCFRLGLVCPFSGANLLLNFREGNEWFKLWGCPKPTKTMDKTYVYF